MGDPPFIAARTHIDERKCRLGPGFRSIPKFLLDQLRGHRSPRYPLCRGTVFTIGRDVLTKMRKFRGGLHAGSTLLATGIAAHGKDTACLDDRYPQLTGALQN